MVENRIWYVKPGRGVAFESPPTRQPWGGYMAIFENPDGNLFYLDQLREE